MHDSHSFERMREDHRRVLEEIKALEAAAAQVRSHGKEPEWPGDRARAVLETLAAQFGTHMAAEHEILFPWLLQALPWTKPVIEPLLAEHGELRAMLSGIQSALNDPPSAMRNESIAIQLRDFTDLLRIHVRKEEVLVFGVAERALPPREVRALAARMNRDRAVPSSHATRLRPSDARPRKE